jgi:hypothetical protein
MLTNANHDPACVADDASALNNDSDAPPEMP